VISKCGTYKKSLNTARKIAITPNAIPKDPLTINQIGIIVSILQAFFTLPLLPRMILAIGMASESIPIIM
jgi:hypothetical protein